MYRPDKMNFPGFLGISVIFTLVFAIGCSAIEGERQWWDDQTKEELASDYMLPESPPEYPVPTDPPPFVPKNLDENEVELATQQEKEQIALGIPRSGVPDPLQDRVVVPAEEYIDESSYENEEDYGDYEEDYDEEGFVDDDFGAGAEEAEEFALEEEATNNSAEARDFMDEMSGEENYTTKGEQNVGASGNTQLDEFVEEGYGDNPGVPGQEATDAQLNDLNYLEDDPFLVP